MTWLSLGSLALPYQLRTQGVQLRTDIARLGEELTTGQVQDPSRHLRGDTEALASITASLTRGDRYLQNIKSAAITADIAQDALSVLDSARGSATHDLLLAASDSTPANSLTGIGEAAFAAMADVVSALSARNAGAAIFSGIASDRAPLVSAEEMRDALTPVVAGLSGSTAIAGAITSAFLDPGGLFDTVFYTGDAARLGPVIAEGQTAATLPTADSEGIRTLLAGLATAAILADPPAGLTVTDQRDLAGLAASQLLSANGGLAALQSQVGSVQSTLEARQTRLMAQRDTLETGRAALIGADPYETASRFQEAESRLDALYTITARTARLSLTEYL